MHLFPFEHPQPRPIEYACNGFKSKLLAKRPNFCPPILRPFLIHHVGQVQGNVLDVLDVMEGPAWAHHLLLDGLSELVPGLALKKTFSIKTKLLLYLRYQTGALVEYVPVLLLLPQLDECVHAGKYWHRTLLAQQGPDVPCAVHIDWISR